MPIFVVNTNFAKNNLPESLLSELNEELTKAMGKPDQV